jgi:hypothetical protein
VNSAPFIRIASTSVLLIRGIPPRYAGLGYVGVGMTTPESEKHRSRLSEEDARFLLVMCVELIGLCAKFIGNFDPTAAAMLLYVRDEIVPETKIDLH